MSTYSLTHVSDAALLRDLKIIVARDRSNTAELLAHIAEVDSRNLYLPAAHPSMYSYCVHELHLSEEAAFKRIHAARAARRFPALFTALADGPLHLSAVVMLAPHLTAENFVELLAAATHRSKAEIERLLAERSPRPDLPERVYVIAESQPTLVKPSQHAPGRVERPVPEQAEDLAPQRLASLSPQRYALQTTLDQETYDLLRHAQSLLGHQVHSGDIAPVLTRALKLLVSHLERRKLGVARSPRRGARRPSANPRHIPAAVKRAVRERDQDQCTFRSESGRRCPARTRLEYDHIEPVARGGLATVENTRLRCRAHNQYDAECAFGAGFMARKREEAREAAAAARRKQAAEEVIPLSAGAPVPGRRLACSSGAMRTRTRRVARAAREARPDILCGPALHENEADVGARLVALRSDRGSFPDSIGERARLRRSRAPHLASWPAPPVDPPVAPPSRSKQALPHASPQRSRSSSSRPSR